MDLRRCDVAFDGYLGSLDNQDHVVIHVLGEVQRPQMLSKT